MIDIENVADFSASAGLFQQCFEFPAKGGNFYSFNNCFLGPFFCSVVSFELMFIIFSLFFATNYNLTTFPPHVSFFDGC